MSSSNIFYVHLFDSYKSTQSIMITEINAKLSIALLWSEEFLNIIFIFLIVFFILYPPIQETDGDVYVRYHPALGITVMALCVANVSFYFIVIVINMYMYVIKVKIFFVMYRSAFATNEQKKGIHLYPR